MGAQASQGRRRALDVGCAVGGMSFELARHFDEVVGIDTFQSFVMKARKIKQKGSCSISYLMEGNIKEVREVSLDPSIDRSRCTFQTGDACALRPDIGSFDAVLPSNLLCRLPEPHAFLQSCS